MTSRCYDFSFFHTPPKTYTCQKQCLRGWSAVVFYKPVDVSKTCVTSSFYPEAGGSQWRVQRHLFHYDFSEGSQRAAGKESRLHFPKLRHPSMKTFIRVNHWLWDARDHSPQVRVSVTYWKTFTTRQLLRTARKCSPKCQSIALASIAGMANFAPGRALHIPLPKCTNPTAPGWSSRYRWTGKKKSIEMHNIFCFVAGPSGRAV